MICVLTYYWQSPIHPHSDLLRHLHLRVPTPLCWLFGSLFLLLAAAVGQCCAALPIKKWASWMTTTILHPRLIQPQARAVSYLYSFRPGVSRTFAGEHRSLSLIVTTPSMEPARRSLQQKCIMQCQVKWRKSQSTEMAVSRKWFAGHIAHCSSV